MNQKQLTQAIREGLNQHGDDFWRDFTKGLYWVLGLFVLVIILFVAWNNFHEARYPQTAMASERAVCNYPYLSCDIYQEKRYFRCQDNLIHEAHFYIETQAKSNISGISITNNNTILPCADISDQIPVNTERLCGYQEANAWFEQFKNNHPESEFKLILRCSK